MKIKYDVSNKTILTLSDMHAPYHHPDSLDFIRAVKKKYKPDVCISMGDLVDNHGISFHDSDPDLLSAGDELLKAREFCKELESVFPNLVVIGSNHGDLPLRRFLAAGIPKGYLRPYNEIYDVKNWRFIDELTLHDKHNSIYFVHHISANGLKVATQRGVCVIQGHTHTKASIDYVSNTHNLLWAMHVGCMIDKKSLAFAYDKLNLSRPILSTGIVINGIPRIIPMILDQKSRWIGKLD